MPADRGERGRLRRGSEQRFRHGVARRPGTSLGGLLDGLLREKGWSTRDLEEATRGDEYFAEHGRITHQYIGCIIRGKNAPGELVVRRLFEPFGFRAVQEWRLEPMETTEEQKNSA